MYDFNKYTTKTLTQDVCLVPISSLLSLRDINVCTRISWVPTSIDDKFSSLNSKFSIWILGCRVGRTTWVQAPSFSSDWYTEKEIKLIW